VRGRGAINSTAVTPIIYRKDLPFIEIVMQIAPALTPLGPPTTLNSLTL